MIEIEVYGWTVVLVLVLLCLRPLLMTALFPFALVRELRRKRLLVLVTGSGVSLVATPDPRSTLTGGRPRRLGRIGRLGVREVWLDVSAGTDKALVDDTMDFLVRARRTRSFTVWRTHDGALGCWSGPNPRASLFSAAFFPDDLREEEKALVQRIQLVKEDNAEGFEAWAAQVLARLDQAAQSCAPSQQDKKEVC